MIRYSLPAVGLAAAVMLSSAASAQTIQINRENKTIAISTTDEATSTADIAAITVGYEVYGPDSDTAYASGAKISHGVLEALHKIGVEGKSIESGDQGVQRNTNFDDKDKPEQRAQKQFVMRQTWTVSVPPQSAAEVIRVAVAAGANQSGAIEWRLSDRNALQAKAAASALVKARAVASQMAEGMHVKLGDLIYASNQMPEVRELNTIALMAPGVIATPPPPPAPPLEVFPQTIHEEATVYAVFSIE